MRNHEPGTGRPAYSLTKRTDFGWYIGFCRFGHIRSDCKLAKDCASQFKAIRKTFRIQVSAEHF
jgi:hypothetical protein